MALTIDLDAGRAAFRDSVTAFVDAAGSLDELALLGASRCHGWTRLDVVVHVIAGWQEMLQGMVSPVEDAPTVDAASYWPSFAATEAADPLATLLAQRRRTTGYASPALAVRELRDVAEAVLRGAGSLREGRYLWQHQVFTAGDFLAIWAVEDVIHQLDLQVEAPLPASGPELTRATIEALVGPFPDDWDAERVVLVGTGREPAPDSLGALADRLPALG